MHPVLHRNLYFVKEHIGMFKASNNFDVLDPETGQEILHCREPNLGGFTKLLRFTGFKTATPFDVRITTPDGQPVVRVKRGVALFLSKVQVFDEADRYLGTFKQKLFSIGGRFSILNDRDEPVCELKGKWHGWDFRFMSGDTELAHVTKKWAGMGKELFTTADNYILQIDPSVPLDHPVRGMILAAVMCIDMVLKEKS